MFQYIITEETIIGYSDGAATVLHHSTQRYAAKTEDPKTEDPKTEDPKTEDPHKEYTYEEFNKAYRKSIKIGSEWTWLYCEGTKHIWIEGDDWTVTVMGLDTFSERFCYRVEDVNGKDWGVDGGTLVAL